MYTIPLKILTVGHHLESIIMGPVVTAGIVHIDGDDNYDTNVDIIQKK